MKYIYTALLLFISCYVLGQNIQPQEKIEPYELKELDSIYELKNQIEYLIDDSRSLTFDVVLNSKFELFKEYPINPQAIYWYKFSLEPKLKTKYLYLFAGMSDESDVFIPTKNGYKEHKLGTLVKNREITYDLVEASNLLIPFDSINFSSPFYLNKKPISDWGKSSLNYLPLATLTNNISSIEKKLGGYSYTKKFNFYSAIIFASFIMFLINYIVSKDKNYLNYSLYLLFTTVMFATRLPYFFNLLNSIEPKLFYYIRVFCITATSGLYFYFVVSFLDFKNNYPKVYKISIIALKSIVVFTIVFISLLIIFPYLPYRVLMMNIFKILFTLLAIVVFVFLLFQKSDIIFKAVLVSSLLLILGNILSIVTNYSFFFLNTVLAEIIIFTVIVSYNNKVNSKKRLQNKFLLEQERIEKQNLLELDNAKSNFFANISHEFRTPLTLISDPINDALADDSLSDKKRQQFTVAKQNSDRLLSLVNQLLDLSKIDAGHLKLNIQNSNITNLVSALSQSFAYTAKQNQVNYLVNIKQSDNKVWFDKDAVEKIVVNLLSNAIKYTPEKGSVVCNAFINDDKLFLEVRNTGKGLTTNELNNIFQRFYQTNELNQGTGIGLALVNELVELHKGTIQVTSAPNEWTTFTVILPVGKSSFKNEQFISATKNDPKVSAHATIVKDNEVNEEFNENEKPILLIVEDNSDLRALIKQNFEASYNVITAVNGKIGVELALKHIPDLIISDIMMPEKDGITLTKELKADERSTHIPIILLTAKAEVESQFKGIETGADDYITKPFDKKLLSLKVDKLIESRLKLQSRYSQEVILKPKDISITNVDEQFLEKIQIVLEDKLVEPSFSIEDFSKAVGMSRMQLHRKIKALTGLSASEFIRSQRLKLAAQLLKKSDINISQVGYTVGFNDHSYFTKCFKEAYNCTPTEYSKQFS